MNELCENCGLEYIQTEIKMKTPQGWIKIANVDGCPKCFLGNIGIMLVPKPVNVEPTVDPEEATEEVDIDHTKEA